MINITAIRSDGEESNVLITEDTNPHFTTEFFRNVSLPDPRIDQIRISALLDDIPAMYVEFQDTCIPENPFYIKWVNSIGGWVFRMFCRRQEITHKLTRVDTYEPYMDSMGKLYDDREDPSAFDTIRNEKIYGLEGEDSIKVSYNFEGPYDRKEMEDLLYSSHVMWWNERVQQWIGIHIKKQSVVVDTSATLGSIEFDVQLSKPTDLV